MARSNSSGCGREHPHCPCTGEARAHRAARRWSAKLDKVNSRMGPAGSFNKGRHQLSASTETAHGSARRSLVGQDIELPKLVRAHARARAGVNSCPDPPNFVVLHTLMVAELLRPPAVAPGGVPRSWVQPAWEGATLEGAAVGSHLVTVSSPERARDLEATMELAEGTRWGGHHDTMRRGSSRAPQTRAYAGSPPSTVVAAASEGKAGRAIRHRRLDVNSRPRPAHLRPGPDAPGTAPGGVSMVCLSRSWDGRPQRGAVVAHAPLACAWPSASTRAACAHEGSHSPRIPPPPTRVRLWRSPAAHVCPSQGLSARGRRRRHLTSHGRPRWRPPLARGPLLMALMLTSRRQVVGRSQGACDSCSRCGILYYWRCTSNCKFLCSAAPVSAHETVCTSICKKFCNCTSNCKFPYI